MHKKPVDRSLGSAFRFYKKLLDAMVASEKKELIP
jgi:hypothetical protein